MHRPEAVQEQLLKWCS